MLALGRRAFLGVLVPLPGVPREQATPYSAWQLRQLPLRPDVDSAEALRQLGVRKQRSEVRVKACRQRAATWCPVVKHTRRLPLQDRQDSVASQVADFTQLVDDARTAARSGDHAGALRLYTDAAERHADLALSEYAKFGRALELFQEGDRVQSTLELSALALELQGWAQVTVAARKHLYRLRSPAMSRGPLTAAPQSVAQVHAALASVLYVTGRPFRAEDEWRRAVVAEPRFERLAWAKEEVTGSRVPWPPRVVEALEAFLTLQ